MSSSSARLAPGDATRGAAAPWGFADGQLEALKWAAVVSMLVDHIGRHLLGHGTDTWIFAVGRLAFPLFALVLALNLARAGDRATRARRTAGRLAAWCALSVLPSIWARGDPWVVNVLGTLALGAAVCWAIESRAPWFWRTAGALGALVLGEFCEFGAGGVALVAAIYVASLHRPGSNVPLRGPTPNLISMLTLALAATLLLATAWLNVGIGGWMGWPGTLASVPVALLVRALPLHVPRWQWLFYGLYPAHLALIGAWKWAA